jgi:hypothetical protein
MTVYSITRTDCIDSILIDGVSPKDAVERFLFLSMGCKPTLNLVIASKEEGPAVFELESYFNKRIHGWRFIVKPLKLF